MSVSVDSVLGQQVNKIRKPFCICPDPQHKWQAYKPTNHKQNTPKITADGGNGPCLKACVLGTSINCSHSYNKIPFRKRANLKYATWSLHLLCKASRGFLSRMFKNSTDIIQLLFSKHSEFWFHTFLSINTVCLNLFVTLLIILSIWKYNTLKFMPVSSPTFHLGIIHEHLFQLVLSRGILT